MACHMGEGPKLKLVSITGAFQTNSVEDLKRLMSDLELELRSRFPGKEIKSWTNLPNQAAAPDCRLASAFPVLTESLYPVYVRDPYSAAAGEPRRWAGESQRDSALQPSCAECATLGKLEEDWFNPERVATRVVQRRNSVGVGAGLAWRYPG